MRSLKAYVKALLYAYPILKTVEKDYEEHITNMALLSYAPRLSVEDTMEKIAEEILEMRNLEWLKGRLETVFRKLTENERGLLAVKYFGKRKNTPQNEERGVSERTYFRRQGKLVERVGELLALNGVTEEVYLRDFAPMELFLKIEKRLNAK